MITIWPCAVLAGVLCIANGGTPAQDKLIMEEVLAHEGFRRLENDEMDKELLMIPALQFWRKMDPALKAEAAEWRKVRDEMAKH